MRLQFAPFVVKRNELTVSRNNLKNAFSASSFVENSTGGACEISVALGGGGR